ncbi:thioredoxin reductase [Mesobacillus campisalis]|uniref:Ferredoxin--NADP reductase n=1 Tax=Mesobacillus campisalis TaxID=1408103 RepID=A0A0M2SZF1_9BACI|nr:NAD(P)/FAD-dependent oxidoreductase [Mesobacillus campisalis]KKK39081.1 thioredoxin reductase [Mesobacillus campisalis]
MGEKDIFDVTIIGGGPAGLYSAFYSGLREMKTKLIEYQNHLGGKLHVYPEKMIWDVGGLTPLPGAKLIEQLVGQGLTFGPEVVLNEKVESISRQHDGLFVLTGAFGQKHYSKTVIVAVGSGILKPKKLEIEGAGRHEAENIHYTVQSFKRFKDKVVMISGGGNTAIDWANALEPIAKKVYITYRKESLAGHEAQISQLMNSTAVCLPKKSITKLIACDNHKGIAQVELTDHATSHVTYFDIDEVIISHGYEQDSSLLKKSELDMALVDDFYIAGNSFCESSVKGIYAAGDILKFDGKLNLIAGCFQDAANAVNKAKQYIEPGANKTAMVSSHNEVFQERNRELVKELL